MKTTRDTQYRQQDVENVDAAAVTGNAVTTHRGAQACGPAETQEGWRSARRKEHVEATSVGSKLETINAVAANKTRVTLGKGLTKGELCSNTKLKQRRS